MIKYFILQLKNKLSKIFPQKRKISLKNLNLVKNVRSKELCLGLLMILILQNIPDRKKLCF